MLPFIKHRDIKRAELVTFLSRGGFPGLFAIRDQSERLSKVEEWIQTTCERDVLQVKKIKSDPDVCYRILEILCHLEEPTQAAVASRLKISIRKAEVNLKALTQIFAIHALMPSSLCRGKTLYFLPDPGMVSFFKGSFFSRLECALLTEFLARKAYRLNDISPVRYYRNSKGHRVHFIVEHGPQSIGAYKLTDHEKYDLRDSALLSSLLKNTKKNNIKVNSHLIGGFANQDNDHVHRLLPWESLF